MSFELDPIYVVYLFVAVSAGLFVEGVYLLFFSGASYRKNVNRRLRLLKDEPDRENVLVQLRTRARADQRRRLPPAASMALNRLVLQSGLTIGVGKLADLRRRSARWRRSRPRSCCAAICSRRC